MKKKKLKRSVYLLRMDVKVPLLKVPTLRGYGTLSLLSQHYGIQVLSLIALCSTLQ